MGRESSAVRNCLQKDSSDMVMSCAGYGGVRR